MLDVEFDTETREFIRGSQYVNLIHASDCTLAAEVGALYIENEGKYTRNMASYAAAVIRYRNPIYTNGGLKGGWSMVRPWMKDAIMKSYAMPEYTGIPLNVILND